MVGHEVRFTSRARYNDVLTIFVRVAAIGKTSYTFHLKLINKRTRSVAEGVPTLVWMNDDQQPVRVPDSSLGDP